jgi:hypothetical protein
MFQFLLSRLAQIRWKNSVKKENFERPEKEVAEEDDGEYRYEAPDGGYSWVVCFGSALVRVSFYSHLFSKTIEK